MSGPLLIKIGGSTLGEADTTFADIAELARRGNPPIVVHGGGAEATRWLEAMNIPTRFVDGKRVTDEGALPVIVAVFAGLVNKRIVAAINGAGGRAVGLSGADGRLLTCRLANEALGYVGEPVSVDASAIDALRGAGFVPVISSVGLVPVEGAADQLVNVNADTVAGSVAAAAGASRVVFLTDIDGVRDARGNVIPSLTEGVVAELVAEGTIHGGMIPKTEACLHALRLGVPSQIVDGRTPGALLNLEGNGTVFERPA